MWINPSWLQVSRTAIAKLRHCPWRYSTAPTQRSCWHSSACWWSLNPRLRDARGKRGEAGGQPARQKLSSCFWRGGDKLRETQIEGAQTRRSEVGNHDPRLPQPPNQPSPLPAKNSKQCDMLSLHCKLERKEPKDKRKYESMIITVLWNMFMLISKLIASPNLHHPKLGACITIGGPITVIIRTAALPQAPH